MCFVPAQILEGLSGSMPDMTLYKFGSDPDFMKALALRTGEMLEKLSIKCAE